MTKAIAGVDEVGRGSLVGPVYEAAVVLKKKNYNLKNIIKGDQKIPEISAASIIAKVSRDRFIAKLSKNFKKYSWHKNFGYGTKDHIQAIKKFGITKHHRKTFMPVHNMLSLR